MNYFLKIFLIFIICLLISGCKNTEKPLVTAISEDDNEITRQDSEADQVIHSLVSEQEQIKLEYFCQLPEGYENDPNKKRPLIFFLHGIGEVGKPLDELKKMADNHSIPKAAATKKDFPFIAISPLCPANHTWEDLVEELNTLLDEVIYKYNADTDRIYLTGLSMGGSGAWTLAMENPERFAALATVCGFASPEHVERIKNIPVWAFHGAKDPYVPIEYQQKIVDALKDCGGNVKFTVYPEVEHDSWVNAYETEELYSWFLEHTRTRNSILKN